MRLPSTVLIGGGAVGLLLLSNAALALHDMRPPLPEAARADLVLIEKSQHRLTLIANGHRLRSYMVALGRGGLARKEREGDGRTPEGLYRIDRQLAHSRYHRALHINYPSVEDADAARRRHEAPGGAVMIHGMRNGLGWIGPWHRLMDWTNGCVAVTDDEIDEIARVAPEGTRVDIRH
ncbi:MAG: L,D-transpeptidase family protein [Alphaproteobacteria bacterium]|nr:L,D-transpeptidase family protein [Alphaproteobacteria bacterium]